MKVFAFESLLIFVKIERTYKIFQNSFSCDHTCEHKYLQSLQIYQSDEFKYIRTTYIIRNQAQFDVIRDWPTESRLRRG